MAQYLTPRETEMLAALKRALFLLESPTMPAHVNAAGGVDAVRDAIARAAPPTMSFCDWLEQAVGTRRWVVAQRLGANMAGRYELAISPKRYAKLEAMFDSNCRPETARYELGLA